MEPSSKTKISAQPDRKELEPEERPVNTTTYAKTRGIAFVSTLFALALSVFCVALDNVIIVTAIPRITDDFHALEDIGWYGSAYLLPTCAFQLLAGKIYRRYSAKWTFMWALFLFEVGSLIAAVAPSSTAFIVGRAIQGVGASGLFSGSLIIISMLVPPEKSPAYQGIIGATFGVSSVVAPLIGGAFTDNVTWRWLTYFLCFYINLPIGGLSAFLLLFTLKLPAVKRTKMPFMELFWKFDPVGPVVLFLPSIVCLLLCLEWGGILYPWSDWRIIVLFVFFALLFITFVIEQLWMADDATVPPRIAKQRTVAGAALFAFTMFGQFTTLVYFIPIYFQAIKGVSAEQSGIDMIPLIVSNVLVILGAGILSTAIGRYVPFFYVSSIISSIGAGLITTWAVSTPSGTWIGYQILAGIGIGAALQLPPVLSDADYPTGVAIILMAEFFGGALFVSVGNNLFNSHLLSSLVSLNIPGLDVSTLVQSGATNLRASIPVEYLDQALDVYMDALRQPFQLSLILSCLSILGTALLEWKRLKGHGKATEAVEGNFAIREEHTKAGE